uniref:Peptidase S54 rhomboid domain-containing protein n=1 Tax=Ascaris lumbricoides TaxID=6252 RepID=A0A9J2NZ56_ASCLU
MRTFFHLEVKRIWYQISNKRRQSLEMAINSSMLNGHVNSLPLLHPISAYSKPQRYTKIPIIYCEDETSIEKTPNPYSLSVNCSTTPLFIPAIVSLQVALFVYYSLLFHTVPSLSAPVPLDSIFIFRSDMKRQVWRYICYAFVHAGQKYCSDYIDRVTSTSHRFIDQSTDESMSTDESIFSHLSWWHLIFNVSVELFIGMPLEISVGTLRTSLVFISGVFAGSLVTSIFEHGVSLMGASGGVYALLALHVANVLFSFDRVDCALCWIIVAVFVASCDTAFAIFDHYTATKFMVRHTAYATHLVGAAAGFSLGLVLLKRDDEKHTRRPIYWSAFAFYVILMLSAIVYNVIVA